MIFRAGGRQGALGLRVENLDPPTFSFLASPVGVTRAMFVYLTLKVRLASCLSLQ